ncbi:MAG: hypothetical protein KGL43_11935 [Burkholderiales bacterium]|nr:hypothetical protein [Burkholderiales bacterium]
MHTRTRIALLTGLTAIVSACGGGGGNGTPPASAAITTGTFSDSVVQGIAVDCGGTQSTTDVAGHFTLVSGQTCTFKVGGVTLGSAPGAPQLSPVDLVPGAVDETNPTVNNITRFLMSLDSDGNPANGITIAPAVATALASATLDFSLAPTAFAPLATSLVTSVIPGGTLVSAAAASTHLAATLLGLFSGSYNCPYAGTASGSVSISITGGVISGTGSPAGGPVSFGVSGMLASSGSANIVQSGSTTNGAVFSGTFKTDGTASGTWTAGSDSGTWTGTKA